MPNLAKAWDEVEQQSQQLVSLAESGEWDQLEEQLALRDAEITRLVALDVPAREAAAVRATLERIKTLNSNLERLAQSQRQSALQGLRQGGSGSKMKAAYGKVQRAR